MPVFGNIGWGQGAWGAITQGQVPVDVRQPSTGHTFGVPARLGELTTVAHARAYIQTFVTPQQAHTPGLPAAASLVLKAKTWAEELDLLAKEVFSAVKNLGAFLRVATRDTLDLSAILTTAFKGTANLGATLQPFRSEDISALLEAISAVDLSAILQTIPGADLPTIVQPIPGVDLGAFGGGHPPADIGGPICAIPPLDMPVFIRGGFSDTADLSTSLTQIGFFEGLQAILNVALPGSDDLGATMRVIAQGTKDLLALLQPIHNKDLPASIITQRVFDTRAIIAGVSAGNTFNLPAIIRQGFSGATNLGVAPIKAVVSTHTSSKLPNLDKVSRPFFQNRYVFGSSGAGLFLLTIEPVFGIFPDLHAQIFAQGFFRDNIRGFIRAAIPGTKDLTTLMTSVVPFVNINKILLSLIPLINLPGDLIQVGGFKPIRGSITPRYSVSTGTADDAGFITTASSYRFYIGTGRGLFIPPQVIPELRITTYRNNFPRPDLHATIEGWYVGNLGASISDYPFSALPATVRAWDLDHIKELTAAIGTFNISDMGASVTPSGGFEDFGGSLTTQGAVSDITASLISFINPLAFNVVSVSTMPLKDIGAIINYDLVRRCAPVSAISSLSGYIKPLVSGTDETRQDLPAELNVLRIVLDMGAEIIGRKRTRISVLGLTFRSRIRASERMRGSITPVTPTFSDMSASISGLLHEVDLPATLTPLRFEPNGADFTAQEQVVNLSTGDVKSVLLSFQSQVSFYVFEEIASAVYSTDRGTWAIDLRSLIRDDSFFDRSLNNREFTIDEVAEFASLDEAIRSAIVVLCERRQETITASITPRGAIRDLGVQLGIISGDRLLDLSSKLVAVSGLPDIAALINTSTETSDLTRMAASITPETTETSGDLASSIIANNDTDLLAEITAS